METVSDMIAGFLAGLTPGTRAGYRSIVSRWLRWCSDNGIDMLRAKRTHIDLPEEITNVIHCKNPRCITTTEQELPHVFKLTDREKRVYRCIYCESKAK